MWHWKECIIFTPQGAKPLKHCKTKGKVIKMFDHELKAFTYLSSGNHSKLTLLRQIFTKEKEKVMRGVLCFQVNLNLTVKSFLKVEVKIKQIDGVRKRLVFSTSFKEELHTPLHSQIPLRLIKELSETWALLVIDLNQYLDSNCYAIDEMSLQGNFKLRFIFLSCHETLKNKTDAVVWHESDEGETLLPDVYREKLLPCIFKVQRVDDLATMNPNGKMLKTKIVAFGRTTNVKLRPKSARHAKSHKHSKRTASCSGSSSEEESNLNFTKVAIVEDETKLKDSTDETFEYEEEEKENVDVNLPQDANEVSEVLTLLKKKQKKVVDKSIKAILSESANPPVLCLPDGQGSGLKQVMTRVDEEDEEISELNLSLSLESPVEEATNNASLEQENVFMTNNMLLESNLEEESKSQLPAKLDSTESLDNKSLDQELQWMNSSQSLKEDSKVASEDVIVENDDDLIVANSCLQDSLDLQSDEDLDLEFDSVKGLYFCPSTKKYYEVND